MYFIKLTFRIKSKAMKYNRKHLYDSAVIAAFQRISKKIQEILQ